MALIFIHPSQRKGTCVLLMSVLFLCSAVFNNSKMTTINVTRYDNLLHLQTWYLLQWQGQNIVMIHGPSITLLQQINVEFNQLALSSILLSLSTMNVVLFGTRIAPGKRLSLRVTCTVVLRLLGPEAYELFRSKENVKHACIFTSVAPHGQIPIWKS